VFASLARYLSLIAIALLLFAAWVHVAIVDPINIGWLMRGQDNGQNALGLAAYLRMGDWPGTRQSMLSAPEGVTLLFTDSNPLLGLLLWPVAGWLPPGVQVIGLWLLACLMLHVLFAWLLVRRVAPDFLAAWLGTALLTMLPTLFNRILHVNLCAHWLILWALWVFIEPRRARSAWWWAAVLGVAALVHAYLLVMVAAIWGCAMLAMLTEGPGISAIARRIAPQIGVAMLVVALMVINGAVGNQFDSTGTYGSFPMAIDAMINPANPSYTALLPSTGVKAHGRGFEGMQYLGAGLLFLVAAAIAILVRQRTVPSVPAILQPEMARLRWLLPAFAVLTLLAIGSHVVFQGQTIIAFPLPLSIVDLLDPVRASGRLFWPVAYTIVLVAIMIAYRLERGRACLLLGGALALQMIDIAPMFAAVRTQTAAADDSAPFKRTLDPRWPAIIATASTIEFHPPDSTRDLQLLHEISWRAMLACRTTRFTYAARQSATTRARLANEQQALRAGRLNPTHLYILFDPRVVPPSLQSRIKRIDGIAFLPATRQGASIAGCR
jgi:hypothetical protein